MYSYPGSRFQYLSLLFRYNTGPYSTTPQVVRFPDDAYDRIWERVPKFSDFCLTLDNFPGESCGFNPTPRDTTTSADVNYVPSKVMQDAWLLRANLSFGFGLNFYNTYIPQVYLPPSELSYVIVYVEDLDSSDLQPYDVEMTLDGGSIIGETGLVHVSNQASMLATPNHLPENGLAIYFAISVVSDSNRKGFIPFNAAEAYAQRNFNFSRTISASDDDVQNLKKRLSMTDWQGDPCTPVPYDWLTCNCILCPGWDQENLLLGQYFVDSLTLSNVTTSALASSFQHPANSFNGGLLTNLSIRYSGVSNPTFQNILSKYGGYSLEYLDLSYNAIESILSADFLGANFLGALTFISMNFSHNQITKIEAFENESLSFGALNILDLSHNAITSLPIMWANTTNNLTISDLSYNRIEGHMSSMDRFVQINSESLQELVLDENSIQGTLDLTKWHDALQEAAFGNSTKTNVASQLFSFVNNSISDIIPSAKMFEPAMDVLMKNKSFLLRGTLLGGNPYCDGATSHIQRYLCRSSIYDNIPKTDNRNKAIMIIGITAGTLGFIMSFIVLSSCGSCGSKFMPYVKSNKLWQIKRCNLHSINIKT